MKGGKVNMSISLFPHNQKAYDSLLETLETKRRACIIHPTGTGKSFIGFKYCEDHPEQSVIVPGSSCTKKRKKTIANMAI